MNQHVEVTFPVRIRLASRVARDPQAVAALMEDLGNTIENACNDEDTVLHLLTPPDDEHEQFSLVVSNPTVRVDDVAFDAVVTLTPTSG